ncbi:histidine kinase/DNA gyrase B/HSP90-like ATPase [Kribbella sp. VKM Ac-2527]|uniref:Histidine kinase/DNA gyrase B/HSP90-like ATPase n=1 Tax=Kribbella caucasensis TaxID=2512215 RepID=A0A4R6KGU3_9ACTN|nr:ATP-binding protein [Kribbella sp. VKM Ac-2527]TDO49261.1 histidine kinase/DNA gyrase B/HSP90-like ATPase [Kribbella sp. VKM Ac-2527]
MSRMVEGLLTLARAEPAGSTVVLRARRHGPTVDLEIRDEGAGMTDEQRGRAFDRFWRAGPPGTGIGLGGWQPPAKR